jgi:hypothetical protein
MRVATELGMMAIVCLGTLSSGCATVVSGKYQTVPLRSEPSGVTVRADDGTRVQTPGSLKLDRSKKHVLTAEREGCEPQQRELRSDLNGWLFGNILLGGVIGAAVDLCSGASGELLLQRWPLTSLQRARPWRNDRASS